MPCLAESAGLEVSPRTPWKLRGPLEAPGASRRLQKSKTYSKSIRKRPDGPQAPRGLKMSSGSIQKALRIKASQITRLNELGRSRSQKDVEAHACRSPNAGKQRFGVPHLRVRRNDQSDLMNAPHDEMQTSACATRPPQSRLLQHYGACTVRFREHSQRHSHVQGFRTREGLPNAQRLPRGLRKPFDAFTTSRRPKRGKSY